MSLLALHALVGVCFVVSAVQAWAMLRAGALHGNDFKHLWAGAWLLARGGNPYDGTLLFGVARQFHLGPLNPYVYPPTTGLMMRPLAWFDYASAQRVWFGLNWALAWAMAIFGPGWLRPSSGAGAGRRRSAALARLVGAVVIVGSMPFYRQMTAGQMNVVAAAWVLLAAGALARRRDALAGSALALGTAWKVAPALLIVALAPLRRGRALWVGILGVVALLGLSVFIHGVRLHEDAWIMMRGMGYGSSTWSELGMDFHRAPFNQSINALAHHLLATNPYTTPWRAFGADAANTATLVATLALGLAWLGAVWLTRTDAARQTAFMAGSVAMLLAPSLMWDHYVVQALPALMWMAGDPRTRRRWLRALGLTFIVAAMCVPWNPTAPINRSGAGILLMSLRLWPTLALFGWLTLDAAAGSEG